MENKSSSALIMPVVALRGLVVFPGMHMHFDVGRDKSVAALKAVMSGNRRIFLVAQRNMIDEDPGIDALYKTGTIASVKQVLRLPGENTVVRVAVEGVCRAKLNEIISDKNFLMGSVKPCSRGRRGDEEYAAALVRSVKEIFELYARSAPQLPPDMVMSVMDSDDPGETADYIAGNIVLEYQDKQKILNEQNPIKRLEKLCTMLLRETRLLELEGDIQEKVQQQMDENQREYYLREQLKVISMELNNGASPEEEVQGFRDKIAALDIDLKSKEKLLRECDRLERSAPQSPESAVSRSYLETCLSLPFGKFSKDNLDLKRAEKILDEDHYGLKKVKERMLEFLAVRSLAPDVRGQIICLVGPPGVGKTSVARSVARAMGREYVRVSLGGVRDEADIRGHRKTYIGSMPGRIISAVQQAGVSNPLVLLDEIDKLGADFKGDPSSALLEVLDAEQNSAFRDHYIEIPFDLSKVFFITTANLAQNIPAPLYDRMEIIELGSYTAQEKFHIAKNHLIKKQAKQHGLNGRSLRIDDSAVRAIISGYTREAGVRKLEQRIAAVCRKAAKQVAQGAKRVTVSEANLEDFLGARRYKDEKPRAKSEVGVVNGLAWTSVGGELLEVEAAVFDGSGKLELTGSLGDVMKESAKAAVSYIRSRADVLGINKNFHKELDIHIHCPEGAVPKDGPSAGVTMTTALVSALTGAPVRSDVAMTGEVTLRGRVLPIGGLKEKSMAAYLKGIGTVIIPADNVSDLDEVDEAVREKVEFIPVENVDEVLKTALEPVGEKSRRSSVPVGDGFTERWAPAAQ